MAYGNTPVAAIGIVFKANMFVIFLQMGLANGVQPLLGYNYGAGNRQRFMDVDKFTKKCCIVIGVLSTAAYFFLREPIIRMFISDPDVVSCGVKMLVGYILSGPFIGILFCNMNCLQSTNHATYATILSVLRQGLLFIPLLCLLNVLFGINGVVFAQSLTDGIATALSIIFWHAKRRQL